MSLGWVALIPAMATPLVTKPVPTHVSPIHPNARITQRISRRECAPPASVGPDPGFLTNARSCRLSVHAAGATFSRWLSLTGPQSPTPSVVRDAEREHT